MLAVTSYVWEIKSTESLDTFESPRCAMVSGHSLRRPACCGHGTSDRQDFIQLC